MRSILSVLAAGLLALGAAGQARAALVEFTGTITVQVATLEPLALTGAATATINNSAGVSPVTRIEVDQGVISIVGFVAPVTDPAAAPVGGLQLTAENGAADFQVVSGTLGGTMPILGVTKVCLFGPCSAAVQNLDVPLSNVGVGGSSFVNNAVKITVIGSPWTTGSVPVPPPPVMTPDMNVTGTRDLTPITSGTAQLVTPLFVSTNISASAVVPAFAVLDMHFAAPEPGQLLLFASGIATLVLLGRSRAR